MAQQTFDNTDFYSDTYNNFSASIKINKDTFLDMLKSKNYILIKNPLTVYHTPWASGDELPVGGTYFEYLNDLLDMKHLEELRLKNLFVKLLPSNFNKLIKLKTLEICFNRSADVETNLAILKSMPSLKYLDLNGSRLSEKQRDYIRIELSKQGVLVNDIVMLQSN